MELLIGINLLNDLTTCESSSRIRIPVSPASPTNTNPTFDWVPDPWRIPVYTLNK